MEEKTADIKKNNNFGTVACACLDTSRLGTTKRKKENPKSSDAELCADPLAQALALTLGGFWDL